MIPLSDSAKARTRPYVNIGIIVACCAVFVYQLTLDELQLTLFFFERGVVPVRLVDWLEDPSGLEEPLTVVTSAFIHAGWLHLFGNMIFLWVFGDNVEDAYGHVKYAVFYVVCAAGAVAVQVFTDTDGLIPMVGASGAIAGVMGAYLMLYPTATVGVLIPWLFFLGTFPIPAAVLIGFWFAIQLLTQHGDARR